MFREMRRSRQQLSEKECVEILERNTSGVLALLGGGGALGWQGCKKMQAIRIEPQPLEVKRIDECATRKELDDFKADVREDFRRVHQRIDNSVEDIAEIKGEMKRIAINQEKILDLLLQRHDKH